MSQTQNLPRGPLRLARGGARIDVYQAPEYERVNDRGDFYVPNGDIEGVDITERAGQPADTGQIELDNYQGKYTLASSDLQIGLRDRLVFRVQLAGDRRPAGEGPAGVGPAAGYRTIGDFLVTDTPEIGAEGAEGTVSLDVMDFPWGVMQNRYAFYGGDADPIAGRTTEQVVEGGETTTVSREESHLNRILKRHAPEIGREKIAPIDAEIDFDTHGAPLTDVIDRLLGRTAAAKGSAIAFAAGRNLVFSTLDELPRPFAAKSVRESAGYGTGGYGEGGYGVSSGAVVSTTPAQRPLDPADFMGELTSAGDGKGIVNYARVDGGIDTNNIEQEANENFDRYRSVNNIQRLTAELFVRKTQIPAIQIWTFGDIDSDNSGLRVRVQASNAAGTGPIAPDDTDSDLISATPREVAISNEDWTRFRMPGGVEQAISDRRPWLIIDATGEDAYQIGVSADGRPLFRVHFAKPIIAVAQDQRSINRYGRVEKHIQDEGLATFESAKGRAEAAVSRRPAPVRVFEGEAATARAHNLRVGDVVPFTYPDARIGTDSPTDYVVTRRGLQYEGSLVRTTLELTGMDAAGVQMGVTSGT